MTVSAAALLKGHYNSARALGKKVVSSDFSLEIKGWEQNHLLFKQAPMPTLSPGGEIEVPSPLGFTTWQPQQVKVAQQGQVSMMETTAGAIDNMLVSLIVSGGVFDAKFYEGTPQKFLRAQQLVECFMVVDNPDRDWENRSQILIFNGTLFFHYFGEVIPGNSPDYR